MRFKAWSQMMTGRDMAMIHAPYWTFTKPKRVNSTSLGVIETPAPCQRPHVTLPGAYVQTVNEIVESEGVM